MFYYSKHPTEKRWIVFSADEQGKLTRVSSHKTNPSWYGYEKIKWPSEYEGAPLTEMIKISTI